jgi:hypothetical protein
MAYSLKFKYSPLLIYALVFINVFLAGGKDLFHNHEFDFNEHDDCPVYVLNINTQTDAIVYYEFNSIITSQKISDSLSAELIESEFVYYFFLRAPPFC